MVHGGDTPDTIFEKTAGRQLTSGRRIHSLNGNNAMSNRRSGVSGESLIDHSTIADFRHRTSMGNQTANNVASGPSRKVDQFVTKHYEDLFSGISAFLPKNSLNSSDMSRMRTQNTAQLRTDWTNHQSDEWSKTHPQKYNFENKQPVSGKMIRQKEQLYPDSSKISQWDQEYPQNTENKHLVSGNKHLVSGNNSHHFSSSSRSGPSNSLSMFKNGTQA